VSVPHVLVPFIVTRRIASGTSKYVARCVQRLGQGGVAVSTIADDARAIIEDLQAGTLREAEQLAAVGGPRLDHGRRDYGRYVEKQSYGLSPYYCDFTLRDSERLEIEVRSIPILLPHEIVSCVFAQGWGFFSATFLGGVPIDDAETLLAFHWKTVSSAPWAKRHPSATTHSHLTPWLIPVLIHGDDASTKSHNGRKLTILSFHGEFSSNDELASRLLVFVCQDEELVSGVTLSELGEVLRWSFDAMLKGLYPLCDHTGKSWEPGTAREAKAGQLLAGGFRFVFQGSLGDWQFHAKLYAPLWHGSSHNFLCNRDGACRHAEELHFTDISAGAKWRTTSISTEDFMEALPDEGNHALFHIPGWDLALVRTDVMHCCFLGIFLVVCGSALWQLVENGHFCLSECPLQARLNQAFWSLVSFCKKKHHKLEVRQFTSKTLGSPSPTRCPELVVKASDCRIIVAWLAEECMLASDIHTWRGKRRAAVTWWQRELTEALEQSPRYLFSPWLERVQTACRKFMEIYLSLSREYASEDPPAYKTLRKVHPFCHMVEDLALDKLNPRLFGAWVDECLMGRILRMAAGQNSKTACRNLLYAWFPMFVELHRNPKYKPNRRHT